jgi:hypothetical protein
MAGKQPDCACGRDAGSTTHRDSVRAVVDMHRRQSARMRAAESLATLEIELQMQGESEYAGREM